MLVVGGDDVHETILHGKRFIKCLNFKVIFTSRNCSLSQLINSINVHMLIACIDLSSSGLVSSNLFNDKNAGLNVK